jgi:hypothetical protein
MSTVRIQVKVPAEWAATLAQRAKQHGGTVSEEVRRLLAGTFGDAVPKDAEIVKVQPAVMTTAPKPIRTLQEASIAEQVRASVLDVAPPEKPKFQMPAKFIHAEKPKLMSALPYPHEHPCFLDGSEKHQKCLKCLKCCVCGKK